jgi:xanthine dehydrogenase accessory factor
MAISENDALFGSIGGGVMEYNMAELAKKKIKEKEPKAFLKRQIHNPDAGENKSGLVCSGEQNHLFFPLNKNHFAVIEQIKNTLEKGDNGYVTISPENFSFAKNENNDYINDLSFNPDVWEYSELIGLKDTLYIFGAGHVSLPLSQLFRMLDFKVIVYDNRKDLSTYINNQWAHRKEIIDYEQSGQFVIQGKHSYAVIMTMGHKWDETVLKELLPLNLKYLGMIGSKNKVHTIFESMKQQGFLEELLRTVDAPVGIPINSQTTAEIAVSIAGAIIKTRNKEL